MAGARRSVTPPGVSTLPLTALQEAAARVVGLVCCEEVGPEAEDVGLVDVPGFTPWDDEAFGREVEGGAGCIVGRALVPHDAMKSPANANDAPARNDRCRQRMRVRRCGLAVRLTRKALRCR